MKINCKKKEKKGSIAEELDVRNSQHVKHTWNPASRSSMDWLPLPLPLSLLSKLRSASRGGHIARFSNNPHTAREYRRSSNHPTNSSVIFIAFGGAGDILSAVTWMEETAGGTSRELHPRQIGPGKNALPDQHLQRAGVNAPGPPSNFPLRWTEPVVRLRGHRRRRRER